MFYPVMFARVRQPLKHQFISFEISEFCEIPVKKEKMAESTLSEEKTCQLTQLC